MKIATFNVNGVNGRLARLLEWLEESRPDIACLQELKAPQDKFPVPLERRRHPRPRLRAGRNAPLPPGR